MRKLTARAAKSHIPGYPDYLATLLSARGITDAASAERYLNPSYEHLYDPYLMNDMEKAVSIIREARAQGKTAAVYGDYDADGVCASAILLEALHAFGVNAFSYIPSRLTEGYGLNMDAISTLSGQAGLLISVDCGITAVSEVKEAKAQGMRVILTDHHTIPEELPPADAVLHPQLGEYPFPSLCGAGVAWKLACALLGLEEAKKTLELAALATVADLVPLQDENRVIVSLGLKMMSETKRLGLMSLKKVCGIREGVPMASEQIAYQLAPRLNAGGRLSTAQQALDLLLTEDRDEAERLANELQTLNQERREVEQQVLREASAQLVGRDLSKIRSLVLFGENWNPGVVGLTAGKLAERWNYPAIVLTKNGEDYSGSGRSVGKIDLHGALCACKDLLTRFGGHKMAAGLALKPDDLNAFTDRFDLVVREQLGEDDLIPETVYDTTLTLNEVSLDTVSKLDLLAPFGLNNPPPVFLMEDLQVVSSRAVGSDQSHLKLTLAQNGAVREGIAFGQAKSQTVLSKEVSIVASVDKNEFNGKTTAQLKVRSLLPGQTAYVDDLSLQARAMITALGNGKGEGNLKPLKTLPELKGTRGTLFVAYTAKTANDLHRQYPELQTFTGAAADPRSFAAIVYAPDFSLNFARFDRIIFSDGLPSVYTKTLAEKATGALSVDALPFSPEMTALFSDLTPSLDELRQVYRQLRKGARKDLLKHPGKELISLKIFEQLNLITLNESGGFQSLLPMIRITPQNSPLYRALTT